jgi:hypothetical protein
MAKRNKTKNSDEETLKHYTPYDEKDLPAEIKKAAEAMRASSGAKPTYIKANISVDKTMTGRKSAVIPDPSSKKTARKKAPARKKKK